MFDHTVQISKTNLFLHIPRILFWHPKSLDNVLAIFFFFFFFFPGKVKESKRAAAAATQRLKLALIARAEILTNSMKSEQLHHILFWLVTCTYTSALLTDRVSSERRVFFLAASVDRRKSRTCIWIKTKNCPHYKKWIAVSISNCTAEYMYFSPSSQGLTDGRHSVPAWRHF